MVILSIIPNTSNKGRLAESSNHIFDTSFYANRLLMGCFENNIIGIGTTEFCLQYLGLKTFKKERI